MKTFTVALATILLAGLTMTPTHFTRAADAGAETGVKTGAKTGAKTEAKKPAPAEFPLGVCLVHEMGYIPELASWKREKVDNADDHVKSVTEQWRKGAPSLEKVITAPLARRLSRWSRKQMAAYKKVSPLTSVKFKCVRANAQQRKIVFEGTIDTLPTHSPIVTRWLRVYVLYDTASKAIVRTTVTIRGQILE